MTRGEFFIQIFLDAGNFIVDCSHCVFGFSRHFGGQFVLFKGRGLKDFCSAYYSGSAEVELQG
jgi:hypothetical protein